jgi:MYXO-CTERM domain-containing protein
VTLPLDAPIGLYVIGFQLSGAGFGRSETFWGIANNGVSEEAAVRGIAAITSAVPEPSTVVLGAFGLLGLLAVRGVRRK